MNKSELRVEVLRYIPGVHTEPTYQHYVVPVTPDQSILSVLHYIKENIDSTLSYRWSCEMAICGSCGAMVNGEPKLLCSTFIKEYTKKVKSLRLEPLNHFPVIRDLIVDISDFLDKLVKVQPYVLNDNTQKDPTAITNQLPSELKKFKQFSLCINCLLCYSACPQYGRDNSFVGPAALTLAHRYNNDSRDKGIDERRNVCASNKGIWECTFAGFCSKVCPKKVAPGSAIQQMKLENTMHQFKQLVKLQCSKKQRKQ